MSWPLPQDFNEAVQSPGLVFQDPELKGGQPVVGAQGLPLPRSGNFADVYQIRGSAGRDFAVKCFTRQVVGLDHRYEQVGRALAKANLPFTVEFTYLGWGIRVGGAWRPVVKMDWIDGLQLNQFVRENAGKPAVLDALLQMWVRLCRRLRDAGIAHADLQHGNVLLVPGSKPGALTLKLIDYDGMYVSALANKPSGETGHACYQHPHRVAKQVYSPDLDRFPHLVVATALQGLIALGPKLWDRYDTGDNLLFLEADFKNPAGSGLMRELWECGDPAARALVGQLALACRKPIPQTPWLDQVAPEGAVTPIAGNVARDAADALGFTQPVAASSGWSEEAAEEAEEPVEEERPQPRRRPAPAKGSGNRMLVIGGAVVVAVGVVVGAVMMFGGKKTDETAQAGANDKKDEPPPVVPKDDRKDRKDDRKDKGKPQAKPPTVAPPVEPAGGTGDPPGNNPPPVAPVAAIGPALDADPAGAPALVGRWEARTTEPVSVVRFTPDGQLLAVAEVKGNRVRVVSARTGADVSVFTGHTAPPVGIVPVQGGLFVSFAPGEAQFSEWNPQTGALTRLAKAPPNFLPTGAHGMLDASSDGRYLVIARLPPPGADETAQPGVLKVLDTQPPGPEVLSVKAHRPKPLFTPDGELLRVPDRNSVQRYKLPSGGYDGGTTVNPAPRPVVIAGSPDGSKYLYTPDGRRLQVLEGHAARMMERLPPRFRHPEAAAAFSPDGRLLAACTSEDGGASHLEVIDLTDRRVVGRLLLRADGAVDVTAVVFAPDGKSVVVGRARSVQFVDLPGAIAAAPAPPPAAAGAGADPDPPADAVAEFRERWSADIDPKLIASVRYDRVGRFVILSHHNRLAAYPFDAQTGRPGQPWLGGPEGRRWLVLPLSGSKFAFTPHFDDSVHVWDAATDNASVIKVPPVPEVGGMRTRMTVKVSPNGRFVAASRTSSGIEPGPAGRAKPETVPLQITDVTSGQPVVALDWLSGSVHFTADSARVLVVDATARFRWFKLPSGQPDGEWSYDKEPSYFASDVQGISARGDTLVYHGAPPGKLDSYYLLDGRTGKVIKSFTPKTYHGGYSAISDDGGVVAFVRNDGFGVGHTVEVFHAPGRLVGRVKIAAGPRGHEGASIALSPDGRSLAMNNRSDHKLTVYDLPAVGAGAVAAADPGPKNPAANPMPDPGPKPADPPPAGNPTPVKKRWSGPADHGIFSPKMAFDPDGRVLFGTWAGTRAYNAQTGAPVPLEGAEKKSIKHAFFPVEKGRMGTWSFGEGINVWETKTGRWMAKIPQPPNMVTGPIGLAAISPNGRYVVYGRGDWSHTNNGARTTEPGVLRVYDTAAGAKVILTVDGWQPGSVHFTANSARMLVHHDNGQCRWYKLPSAQPDGEWNWGAEDRNVIARTAVFGMSDDGRAILYRGLNPTRESGTYLLDGKNGQVLRTFPKELATAALSADGRVVAGLSSANRDVWRLDLFDAATGVLLAQGTATEGTSYNPALAISADGRSVAVHNQHKTLVTVFDGPTGLVAARPPIPDPDPSPAPKTNPNTPVPAVGANRLPAPDGDALAKAEANVRAVLKDDYARKQPGEKKVLAQKLITLAEGTTDDPVARYVMLRDARDLAAEVGDPALAVQAIEALARWYEIDPAAAKLAALEKTLSVSSNPTTLKVVNELAAAGADAAFDADDYADAVKLAQAAATAARKGGLGPAAIEDADFRLAHLKKTRDAFDAAQPALEKLKATPDDPDANLVVGKFRCFVQGRWADGMKLLAKGSSPTLKQVAELELAAPASGPADVKVADAWWDIAQAAPDAEKRAAEARARYWYVRAVPGLMGLARAKVEGRLGFTHNNTEYKPGLLTEFSSKQASVLKGKKARIDPVIDFSAGEFAASGAPVDVTVKWTGVIVPPRPGRYKLVASGTDSVRIRADGKTVIDTIANKNGKREGSVLLQDRPAQLVVEFTAPNIATHALKLSWVPAGGIEEGVPAEALFHDRKAELALGK
jgi:WD40 repeat protein